MEMLYSKGTRGFYCLAVHGENIPEDAVAISGWHYAELLAAQSQGKEIVPGDNGFPVEVDRRPAPDDVEQAAREWRNNELVRADNEIRKHKDADGGATATEQDWRDYRVSLRAWPENPDFPSHDSRPSAPAN